MQGLDESLSMRHLLTFYDEIKPIFIRDQDRHKDISYIYTYIYIIYQDILHNVII